MITPQDLQKWQQAEQGIDKLRNEFASEELQAYQKLSELFKSESFHSNECNNCLPILKHAMRHTKNRLLKAHLTNFVALIEKYFTVKTAAANIPTPQPAVTPQAQATTWVETPKEETPKVVQPKAEHPPKSKWGTTLLIIIALLLIGGYYAYNQWDIIYEKFFPPKNEIVEVADTLIMGDEMAMLDSLEITSEMPVDSVQIPVPEPAPKPPVKKTLTDVEIFLMFSDVSIGDNEALERFIKEVGSNIPVEGVENIDNSYELAHDAFLYNRDYSISVQRNSNGKISKIIVE